MLSCHTLSEIVQLFLALSMFNFIRTSVYFPKIEFKKLRLRANQCSVNGICIWYYTFQIFCSIGNLEKLPEFLCCFWGLFYLYLIFSLKVITSMIWGFSSHFLFYKAGDPMMYMIKYINILACLGLLLYNTDIYSNRKRFGGGIKVLWYKNMINIWTYIYHIYIYIYIFKYFTAKYQGSIWVCTAYRYISYVLNNLVFSQMGGTELLITGLLSHRINQI